VLGARIPTGCQTYQLVVAALVVRDTVIARDLSATAGWCTPRVLAASTATWPANRGRWTPVTSPGRFDGIGAAGVLWHVIISGFAAFSVAQYKGVGALFWCRSAFFCGY
jgi:hypothetical protein